MKPRGKKITTLRKEEGGWRGEERERPYQGERIPWKPNFKL
jgi:hypothetical protein